MPYSSHGKKLCDQCGYGGVDYVQKADGLCDCCGYPFSFEGSQPISGHCKDLPIVKIRLHEDGEVRTLSGRWLDEKSFFVEGDDGLKSDMDSVFDRIDNLLLDENFREVDEILESVPIEETKTDILLTYLTSTLPVCTKLKKRESFRVRVESEVFKRGESEPFLFESLSGTHYLLNESIKNAEKLKSENTIMKIRIENLKSISEPENKQTGREFSDTALIGVITLLFFAYVLFLCILVTVAS